jgi:membrane protein DedA with SNARE-associated domain
MFSGLEQMLLSYINTLSLEMFVLIASFIEEVVAPIPSPTVMMLAGSFAAVQERTLYALIVLSLIGAVGKTIGAIVVYVVSDKAEDFVLIKFGKFFGVTHEEVEQFGTKLGNGVRDYFLLTGLRALPIMPSVIVSVGSGLLKVPMTLFIVSTFFGTIVRDGIYLYAGYAGTELLTSFVRETTNLETVVEIISLAILAILFFYILKRRRNKAQ